MNRLSVIYHVESSDQFVKMKQAHNTVPQRHFAVFAAFPVATVTMAAQRSRFWTNIVMDHTTHLE